MPSEEPLRFEIRGPVAWLTLNRPAAMNALSPELLDALSEAVDRIEADVAIRAVVLTGAGRAFCAGADLAHVLDSVSESNGGAPLLAFVARAEAVLARIELLPMPVIAAVNGLALAGGLELVLCCDLVLAAESARLGDAHANYGLLPGAGGSVRLPRKLGPTRAKQLLFTGELQTASTLAAAGLVNQVVPDGELTTAAQKLGESLAEKSPLTLRAMKRLVDDGLQQPPATALRVEQLTLAAHLSSRDVREGLTAFREKRKPHFEGR